MWCLFDMMFDAYALRMLMIKLLIVFNIWDVTNTESVSKTYWVSPLFYIWKLNKEQFLKVESNTKSNITQTERGQT
jgi:hypothetical protein